jgi:hypothetical protein
MRRAAPRPPTAVVWPAPVSCWPAGVHHLRIDSLQRARELFGSADAGARRLRSQVFYRGIEKRQRLPQGMHDRCEEYVFAAGQPGARDLAGLARHLPLHCKVIRQPCLRLAAGEVLDLTVERRRHWPELDALEELYVFLCVDRLILGVGACLIVQGNVFGMQCGDLVAETGAGVARPFDIGILPTPFSVDRSTSPHTGAPGAGGRPGQPGATGREIRSEGSLFGPRLCGPCPEAKTLDGENGSDGEPGEDGRRGFNGGMCRLADLRIERLLGFSHRRPLRVFAQAGRGGDGGDGGAGGDGGPGGAGAPGLQTADACLRAGQGGQGGVGGDGGNGGNGGNGGIASSIFLELPASYHALVRGISLPSEGGQAGRGGAGGAGGGSGNGGKPDPLIDEGLIGLPGQPGSTGRHGADGRPGKSRPGARIYLVAMAGEASAGEAANAKAATDAEGVSAESADAVTQTAARRIDQAD